MSGFPGNRDLPESYDFMIRQRRPRNILDQKYDDKKLKEKNEFFLHVREHVVASTCLYRCLLEFTARKLCRFVMKILKLYGLKLISSI